MLNLDTDILLHGLPGNLARLENVLLSNDTWSISAIVLWEFAKLAEPGRIDVDLDDLVLTRTLASIQTWPVTLDICRTIKTLDFDSDPTAISASAWSTSAPGFDKGGGVNIEQAKPDTGSGPAEPAGDAFTFRKFSKRGSASLDGVGALMRRLRQVLSHISSSR